MSASDSSLDSSVVAVVTQHGADPSVVDAAIAAARERGVPLVFYVHDATHRFGTVRPTFWCADVTPTTLLSAVDLERCGEHAVALLVTRATAAGVTAYGMLADQRGQKGVAAAAEHALLTIS